MCTTFQFELEGRKEGRKDCRILFQELRWKAGHDIVRYLSLSRDFGDVYVRVAICCKIVYYFLIN